MSRVLGSWIEVTIPNQRMLDPAINDALRNCVKVVGGTTVTQGEGFYIREDNGQLDREEVSIVRWDFDAKDQAAVRDAVHGVVCSLLRAGEESVLRRKQVYGHGYKSELVFA